MDKNQIMKVSNKAKISNIKKRLTIVLFYRIKDVNNNINTANANKILGLIIKSIN